MGKVKAKINSCDDLAPVRILRSRNRNCVNHETSSTVDVSATMDQQELEKSDAAEAVKLFPQQECAVVLADVSCITNQEVSAQEKLREATNEAAAVHIPNEAVTQLQETTETNPNLESKESQVHIDIDMLETEKDKGKVASEEERACRDPPQTEQPIPEELNGSSTDTVEKLIGAKRNHEWDNEEASHDKASEIRISEIKETTQESTLGLPAKKKRRMGMCGLTEKERSHFLLVQNGTAKGEKEMGENTADEPGAAGVCASAACPPPSPPPVPADQSSRAAERQSDQSGAADRLKTEVHVAATITVSPPDGTDAVCDPEGKSCEAERGVQPCSEESGHPKPDQIPQAEEEEEVEEVETHLENQRLQERKAATTEDETEEPEKQMNPKEEKSRRGLCDSDAVVYASRSEKSRKQDAVQAADRPANGVTETDEGQEDEGPGNSASGSCGDTRPEVSCSSVQLCRAAQSCSVSERTQQRGPDQEPAAGPTELVPQAADTVDPFGSRCSDYVSDSQLNTIDLIEKEQSPGSLDLPEDGTHLISGLIRELSSLNHKVMATYRELEVLRWTGKRSRNFSH